MCMEYIANNGFVSGLTPWSLPGNNLSAIIIYSREEPVHVGYVCFSCVCVTGKATD